MMSLFEASWVIARRDFAATVYSRTFLIFLIVPLLLFGAAMAVSNMINDADRETSQPVIAVVTDTATHRALETARDRLIAGTHEQAFPLLRYVSPAENVGVQAGNLLADESEGYSAVLSGTLDRPVLTGPEKIEDTVANRARLIVDDARRMAAIGASGGDVPAVTLERAITGEAAGNLQSNRRDLARGVQSLFFALTVLLATLLISNIAEEKTNKVIEIMAAAVPLDAVFFGKLISMVGVSLVGLALWGGTMALGYLFIQVLQDWVTLPQSGPAVGWPVFFVLALIYYVTNYMLLGSLFLGIGSQASNIREIQTLTMPVTLIQGAVFFLAVSVVGSSNDMLAWIAYLFPFSSPMAMIAYASETPTLWPHLLAIIWQLVWVMLIVRISARLFRLTVLKSSSSGSFFGFLRGGSAS